jgi:hypothetical protein
MKKFIKFIVIAFAISSCSKENLDETLIPKNQPTLISSVYANGSLRETFQNGKLISDFYYNYTYQGPSGLLLKRQEINRPTYYNIYTYNTDLTIKSIDDFQPSNTYRYAYTYSSGSINLKIYRLPNLTTILSQYNYVLQNGVITTINGIGSSYTQSFDYDQKGNIRAENSSNYTYSATFDNKPSVAALKLKGMFGDNYKTSSIIAGSFDNEQLNNNVLIESSVYNGSTSYYYSYEYLYAKTNYPYKITNKDNGGYIIYNYSY